MTDTNEEKTRPARIFQPLPEIEDNQPLAIAAEVDLFLAAVMEKAREAEALSPLWEGNQYRIAEYQGEEYSSMQVSLAEFYEERVGRFEEELTDDPARFLKRKTHFLRSLLRKGLYDQEKWLEKWKDLLPVWFTPLMRIAVYEPDPSFNRWFLEPALRTCGYRRVLEALLEYLEHGTTREKAGAIRAFYWAWAPNLFTHIADLKAREEYFQRFNDELADLSMRARILLLKTFVECEDLTVRRSIIPQLRLSSPSSYPQEWQHLIPVAIHLARTHPDEYIRHRVDIQLGGSGHPSQKDAPLEGNPPTNFQQ